MFYSINYENNFYNNNDETLSGAFRIGISYHYDNFVIPFEYFIIIGNRHNFELGIGYTLVIFPEIGHLIFPKMGYMYQMQKIPLYFRAHFTSIFYVLSKDDSDVVIQPWGGLGVGIRLNDLSLKRRKNNVK